MTRTAPRALACAFQDLRSIAIVIGLMVVSAIAGWLIGRS